MANETTSPATEEQTREAFMASIKKMQTILLQHQGTDTVQRIQSYCVAQTGKKSTEYFADGAIPLSEKLAYVNGVVSILERKAWAELPSAPKAQATPTATAAASNAPTPKPAPRPEPKEEAAAPAPKPAPAATPPAPPQKRTPAPAAAPAPSDPFTAAIYAAVDRRLAELGGIPDAAPSITEADIKAIVALEVRAVLHEVFGKVSAACAPAKKA